ncbi:MAG: carboxypeptidase-like regulatory domain-containing protein [Fibrobacter sp.]|nr:carboxypeptidase-like regulatory domain-containing protein [Fibrobacter sp.]
MPAKRVLTAILFLVTQTVLAQSVLTGTVVDQENNPVSGASVLLQKENQKKVTDGNGKFSFTTTGIGTDCNLTTHTGKIIYRDRILFLQNPELQKVNLEIFNLSGQRISILFDGVLEPGLHRFRIAQDITNQTVLFRWKTAHAAYVYKITTAGNAALQWSSGKPSEKKRASAPAIDRLVVTHMDYDDVIVPVTTYNDEIRVEMNHGKLSLDYLNLFRLKDTLWNSAHELILSLDSIADHRCCCQCLCAWEGFAEIFFTLTSGGKKQQIRFSTYDSLDIEASGYRLAIGNVSPECPKNQESGYAGYTVQIGLTPVDNPRSFLFLNQREEVDMQSVSGTGCAALCIDFPTYSYNAEKRLLRGIVPQLNDSVQIIFGSGTYMTSGGLGSGAASVLYGVKSIPWNNHKITINKFENDGSVEVMYSGETFVLSAGDRKAYEAVEMDTSEDCVLQITTRSTLVNYGFLYPWQISPDRYR